MKTLGNILWHFPFFGFVSAIVVYAIGVLLTLTVVAAPIGLGLMELGQFLFFPFGHAMVSKADLNVQQNKAWGAYSTIVTIVYLPFGILLVVCAAIQVVLLFCTIIGIPVGLVVAKSLGTYLNPVNKKCVSSSVANELERRAGQQEVAKHLGPEKAVGMPKAVPASGSAVAAAVVAPAVPAAENNGLKTCPRCAEDVKRAAVVCRYCGFEFPPAGAGPVEVAPAAVEPVLATQPGAAPATLDAGDAHRSSSPNRIVIGGALVVFLAVLMGGVSYFQSRAPKADPQVQEATLAQLGNLVAQRGIALRNDSSGKDLIAKYLDHGGSPDMRVSGYSLISIAAQSGYVDLVKRLIERGADVNLARDGTPLYWSIVEGQHEAALLLIRGGADVNLEKSGGWSPMDAAQRELNANDPRTKEVIQALLEKGAHPGSTNRAAAAVLVSVPQPVAPPAPAPMSPEAPPIHVGDRYVYETRDLDDPKLSNVVAREVVGAERGEFIVKFVNQKSGYTRTNRFTGDWSFAGTNASADEASVFTPPLQYFKFPMREGERWTSNSTETNTKTGKVRYHTIEGVIEGADRVTVPSGTFDAIRVMLKTTTREGDKVVSGIDTSWYVPQVKRPVRSEISATVSDTGKESRKIIQLLSYDVRQ